MLGWQVGSSKIIKNRRTSLMDVPFVKNILAWTKTFWTLVKKQSLAVKSHFWSGSNIFFSMQSKLIYSCTACKYRFIILPEYNLARNFRRDDTLSNSLYKNRMAAKIAASYRCIYNVIIGSQTTQVLLIRSKLGPFLHYGRKPKILPKNVRTFFILINQVKHDSIQVYVENGGNSYLD